MGSGQYSQKEQQSAAGGGRRFAGEEAQDEEDDSQKKADAEIEVIARPRGGEPEWREKQKRQAEAEEEAAFHDGSLRESHRSRLWRIAGVGQQKDRVSDLILQFIANCVPVQAGP